MLHLPILRQGRPYRSLDVARPLHHRTRQPFVEISQANAGLIRRDLREEGQRGMRDALAAFSARELLALCARAAQHFVEASLPLGDGLQAPEDYVHQTSATTGLPYVLVRRNMEKIRGVLAQMAEVVAGLTRSLDLSVLDEGTGEAAGHALSYAPRAHALGVVLPSNSPGVHSLWAPAIAFKTALVLKPGAAEPWTPWRMVQALLHAGAPPEAFGFYPTDHTGAAAILQACGRSILFGDIGAVGSWRGDPRVELHGPGYSKVVLGPDASEHWRDYVDVMVGSILENGGRSCVNASGIWVTANAREIAEAVGRRLAEVVPRAAEDDAAQLAPFADAGVAARIDAMVEQGLSDGGARDVTAAHRSGPRLVAWEGCSYLLPTLVLCESPQHPLANREFLFPFASVVEVPAAALPEALGPSLAVTAITEDRALRRRLLDSPLVQRLNLGPVPTWRVGWDQPHEGNLFDHLYVRRALQLA